MDEMPSPTDEDPTPARHGSRGAGLVEYALLISLIVAVCFAAVTFLGQANSGSLDDTASLIGSAVN